jgi:hypothetical protein
MALKNRITVKEFLVHGIDLLKRTHSGIPTFVLCTIEAFGRLENEALL